MLTMTRAAKNGMKPLTRPSAVKDFEKNTRKETRTPTVICLGWHVLAPPWSQGVRLVQSADPVGFVLCETYHHALHALPLLW